MRNIYLMTGVFSLVLLSGCEKEYSIADGADCDANATPIHEVQGKDFASPLSRSEIMVRGVVTRINSAGAFIESTEPDDSPETSEGLYLKFSEAAGDIVPGTVIAAGGRVRERGEDTDTQTTLMVEGDLDICERSVALPLTDIQLPLEPLEREAVENMRINVTTPLVVSDVYGLRDGEIRVSGNNYLPAPTEIAFPGQEARQQLLMNQRNSLSIQLQQEDRKAFPVGTRLGSATGVLGHDGNEAQLFTAQSTNLQSPGLTRVPKPEGSDIRVASLNLRNFFNGNGVGGGFPNKRGAETRGEYERQRRRLIAQIKHLQPHVVGVMELENDGFEPNSASSHFLRDLRNTGRRKWEVVDTGGKIGRDQITVGLFFRSDLLEAVSPAFTHDDSPFTRLSRKPLAIAFRHIESGQLFMVVVNHFKSKGSCPNTGPDRDQGDGQGCWNDARLRAARSMTEWVKPLSEKYARGNLLIIGDLNAYRQEDPVQAIAQAGYQDLTATSGSELDYSYVYYGQAGTLDHAFASRGLARFVSRSEIVHINAGWPVGMELKPNWLRVTDHDPVLVDLRFRK